LLFVDSYDSFSYNIVNAFASLGADVHVVEANERLSPIDSLEYDGIVIGPGPGTPRASGPLMRAAAQSIASGLPTLGICLGMQAIATAYGGAVVAAPRPVHGEVSEIHHGGTRLFAGLPSPLRAARYHSLCVEARTLPGALHVCATSDDGVVQALDDSSGRIFGLQFHPESFLSERGERLLLNFLNVAKAC
jgi:anthranilate synthase/aminodeoxychorismate synthase-like glutamine amidotransferase